MTSVKTQLPFEYYSIPICKPENLQYKPENLGKFSYNNNLDMLAYRWHSRTPNVIPLNRENHGNQGTFLSMEILGRKQSCRRVDLNPPHSKCTVSR